MIPITDSIKSFKKPIVTYTIIAINVLIFIWQYFLLPDPRIVIMEFGFIPAKFFATFDFSMILTSMFIHGSLGHLFGNMLYLYIFGDNVEDVLGHFGFLIAYILWGTVAAITQGILNPSSHIPMVGASGAISGVIGAYFVFFPSSRIVTLLFIPPLFIEAVLIPAWFYIGFWFLMQLFSGIVSLPFMNMGGVAFWAHVGGFVAGYFTARFLLIFSRIREEVHIKNFYSHM